MKNFRTLLLVVVSLIMVAPATVSAQDESAASIDGGLDIYSSYIWRGAKFGSGPAFQPWVEGTVGGLAIGAWGSVNASTNESLEMDLYLGYSFDFGLSLAVTDYYFGGDWTEFSANHYIEPMASFEVGGFSATAALMLLPETADDPETPDDDESTSFGEEQDLYFEAGYSWDAVSIALGAGDGQYTDDGDFNLCNITVGTSKEITITDSFSLPLSAAVTLNPATGGFFIYAGISF